MSWIVLKRGVTLQLNQYRMKPILLAVALIAALASCKKEEPECYSCQWVKQGKIQPGSEQHCGPDVQDWALRVRIEQPNFYPVCSRIK